MNDWIAEAQLFAREPGSTGHTIHIRIGRPSPNPDQIDWGCVLELTGIEKPFTVVGLDAMQALNLALGYLRVRLSGLQEKGWRFYRNETDTELFDFETDRSFRYLTGDQ